MLIFIWGNDILKDVFSYRNKIKSSELGEELEKILQRIERLKFPVGFLDFILYAISEIFANIKEHSQAREILIDLLVAQKKCKINISDNGIGFRESYLKKGIYPKDDSVAIEFALSGLSTKDPKERGFGLYSIRKLVEALGGRLILETGLAKSILEGKKIGFRGITKREGVKVTFETPIKKIDFYKHIH